MVAPKSRLLFVNDGNTDTTWKLISQYAHEEHTIGISQSRNRGHQSSIMAGLMEAAEYCDISITVDCDGQDDLEAMDKMIFAYQNGCDVVYGVCKNRDTDSFFKRNSARLFYKWMKKLDEEIVYNHGDYRLLSKRVMEELKNYQEVNLFLRGMIPLVGFKCTSVYYTRNIRLAGKSHYSLWKMIGLALDGLTSLSVRPLRLITILGFVTSMLSFCMIIWIIAGYFTGSTITGWPSTCAIVCFMGGIQLLCLGVIGEYVGRVYMETKKGLAILSVRERQCQTARKNVNKRVCHFLLEW